MKIYRLYIRYFIIGFLFAPLVLGSMAIKATHPDTPLCQPFDTERCEPQTENCQPFYHPILRDCDGNEYCYPIYIKPCQKSRVPCPLDIAVAQETTQLGGHFHEK